MIYNKEAYELGSKRSAIRELFEYGNKELPSQGLKMSMIFLWGILLCQRQIVQTKRFAA